MCGRQYDGQGRAGIRAPRLHQRSAQAHGRHAARLHEGGARQSQGKQCSLRYKARYFSSTVWSIDMLQFIRMLKNLRIRLGADHSVHQQG